MNIYEELVTISACISMDLNNHYNADSEEKKKEIFDRIERQSKHCMEMAIKLRDDTKDIYEKLKSLYPVNFGESMEAYNEGFND